MLKPALAFLFLLSFAAQAQDCKVYGISDSPQKLTCAFEDLRETYHLTCKKGQYLLNETPIKVAFHLDVESGPSPLVFKGENLQLTIMINSRSNITAELQLEKIEVTGKCN